MSYVLCRKPVPVDEEHTVRNVYFVIDGSSCMSGTKWAKVKAGIGRIRARLSSSDFVSVSIFAEEMKLIDSGNNSDIKLASLFNHEPAGKKAIFSAIASSCKSAVEKHAKAVFAHGQGNVKTYIIFVTDGSFENDASGMTADECTEILISANRVSQFSVMFAGVDPSASGLASLQALASIGDADILYTSWNDAVMRDIFTPGSELDGPPLEVESESSSSSEEDDDEDASSASSDDEDEEKEAKGPEAKEDEEESEESEDGDAEEAVPHPDGVHDTD